MQAGRELDALIAEKVIGKPWRKPTHGTCCTCQRCGYPNDSDCECGYTEYIEKAWPVVEKMKADEQLWIAFVWALPGSGYGVHAILRELSPTSICLAALKAVGYEMPITDAEEARG